MNKVGPVAVVCIPILAFAYMADVEPLFIALGVIGLLSYLAFAGTQAYKKKPEEQKGTPWYMD